MIAIVDYQAGNLASVRKAFDHLGHEAAITSDLEVMPGPTRSCCREWEISRPQRRCPAHCKKQSSTAIDRQIPLLGICLGMQWMFESSTEAPQLRGLGLFAGECEKFPAAVKSPHVGWNQLQTSRRFAFAARASARFVRVFHALLSGSVGRRYRRRLRVWWRRFPRWWSADSFLECSFIPKSQDRRGFNFCAIFVNFKEFESEMLTKRIIACLDVDGGRVVKGVQFSDLRDAGDPAELALTHGRAGADEIVLLDISATYEHRSTLLDVVRRTARAVVYSFHRGRRHPIAGRCRGCLRCRRRQGRGEFRGARPIPL